MNLKKHIHQFERFPPTVSCFTIIAFGLSLSNFTNIFPMKQDLGGITFGPWHLMKLPQKFVFVDGVLQFHRAINTEKGKHLWNYEFCFFFLSNGNKNMLSCFHNLV